MGSGRYHARGARIDARRAVAALASAEEAVRSSPSAMCGRFTLTVVSVDELVAGLGLPALDAALRAALEAAHRPRYNVAPRQSAWIVRARDGVRELSQAGWGLVPRWSRAIDHAGRPINARAETIAEKPSFRAPFARKRAIVVADGFYEWAGQGASKRPVRFRASAGGLLRIGAVYDDWIDPADGRALRTFAIVTTGASLDVADVHDRMPLLLQADDALASWLDVPPLDVPAPVPTHVVELLRPAPAGTLTRAFANKRVGSVKHDDPGLLDVEDEPA
jgi:putative SOS response-associated peptidase YedK